MEETNGFRLITFIISFEICDGQFLLCLNQITKRFENDLRSSNHHRTSRVSPEWICLLKNIKITYEMLNTVPVQIFAGRKLDAVKQ